MTNDEINAAIAQECGWKHPLHPAAMAQKQGWSMPEVWWLDSKGKMRLKSSIPNYCGCLNAMHEAETLLGEFGSDEWHAYDTHLAQSNISYAGQHTHATARQRAEAFLRVLGKWEEVAK